MAIEMKREQNRVSIDPKRLLELGNRAQKVVDLIRQMDSIFPNNRGYHDKVCIMAAIQDAYFQGVKDVSCGEVVGVTK